MIKASTRQVGRLIVLRVEGHADYAPNGQDIVCSAASILTSAASNLLPRNRYRTWCGGAVLAFSRFSSTEQDYLRLIAVGFAQLAKTYPNHVKFHDNANTLDKSR